MEKLKTKFQKQESEIQEIHSQLKGINSRIDGIESTINNRIDGIERRIDGIESTINSRIDGIESRIDGIESTINSRIDGIESTMGQNFKKLENQLKNFAQKRSYAQITKSKSSKSPKKVKTKNPPTTTTGPINSGPKSTKKKDLYKSPGSKPSLKKEPKDEDLGHKIEAEEQKM